MFPLGEFFSVCFYPVTHAQAGSRSIDLSMSDSFTHCEWEHPGGIKQGERQGWELSEVPMEQAGSIHLPGVPGVLVESVPMSQALCSVCLVPGRQTSHSGCLSQ